MNLSDFICGPDGELEEPAREAFEAAATMFSRARGVWTPDAWIALPSVCRGIAAAAAERVQRERIVAQARATQGAEGFAEVKASLDGGKELESIEVDRMLDVLTSQVETSAKGGR